MVWALGNLPIFFAAAVLTFFCSVARASEPETARVLVLHLSESPETQAREQRFSEELALALEGVAVVSEAAPPTFAAMPLSEQLAWVRAHATEPTCAATLWLSFMGDSVLLHLVALQTERALVRIVRAKQRPSFEAELSLLAKELMGEAYLFAAKTPVSKPISKAVAAARLKVRGTPRESPRFELQSAVEATLGLQGGVGPRSQLGAGLGLGLRSWKQLWLSLAAYGLTGPNGQVDGTELRTRELGVTLSSDYRSRLSKLELSPVARISLSERLQEADASSGTTRTIRRVSTRAALGARGGLWISQHVCLWLELTLATRGFRTVLRRASDDVVVARTPWLDGALRLGLSLQFP